MQVRDRLTALHNACTALRSTATTKAAQNKVTKALEKLAKTADQPLKDGQPAAATAAAAQLAKDPAGPSQLAAQAVEGRGCPEQPAGQLREEPVAMEVDCPEGEANRSGTLALAQVRLAQAWHSSPVPGTAAWSSHVRGLMLIWAVRCSPRSSSLLLSQMGFSCMLSSQAWQSGLSQAQPLTGHRSGSLTVTWQGGASLTARPGP